MPIQIASEKNIPALVALINSAYRGDGSKQGWTTEADIIAGAYRILPDEMEALMKKTEVTFLMATNDRDETEGTVFLEKRGEQLYLGMLSVAPGLQGKGTGQQLLLAAEPHARQLGCHAIVMRVIHLRSELIAWYERRGYYNTGTIEHYTPSPYETIIIPFHFVILQKEL